MNPMSDPSMYMAPQQQLYYSPQGVPLLPAPYMQPDASYYLQYPTDVQQTELQYVPSYPYHIQPTPHSQPVTSTQQPTIAMRAEAPEFSPTPKKTTVVNPKPTVVPPTPTTNNVDVQTKTSIDLKSILADESESKSTTAISNDTFAYDLEKYKYDYFISKLTGNFDSIYQKFGSPTGICSLTDNRLLVANYDRDSLVLIDLKGHVYHLYRDLPAPKDVRIYSRDPFQALVATKKEVVILDLETSKVVVRTKSRGFYPWNIQYLQDENTITACDPSGERIVYFDKDLTEVGVWSFSEQEQQSASSQPYQKIYPYAAHFCSDNSSFVLTHRNNTCQLQEKDVPSGKTVRLWNAPVGLQAYSVYTDSARKCLIPDKTNHCLISVSECSTSTIHKCKSIYEPYSLTFLSTGTLCVTDWNKSFGTTGGVAILSETDLTSN
ncbi:unnamed protein product [Adineta ricciae]|uniref:Uncharacterized protein n=2 Tax=Adineta ricciae TaxID=249248 RepID=A0A814QSL3_ADIRI|nr:unnamed protein product [Adineta ricciae]